MQGVQSVEIRLAAIDHNNGACGPVNDVEHVDIVHFPRGNVHENWDTAAQIDGGGIHGIQRLLES